MKVFVSATSETETNETEEKPEREIYEELSFQVPAYTDPGTKSCTVQHISVPMQWYEHIFEEDMHEAVRKTVSTFAYEENDPVLFHCSMGRDRTGTTAFLILGLLGVDEGQLCPFSCNDRDLIYSYQGALYEKEDDLQPHQHQLSVPGAHAVP